MEKYVFGGYVQTGGKFDDGREWAGVLVMLAPLYKGANKPTTAKICKGRASILDDLKAIEIGQFVAPACDMTGRIIDIDVVD